MRQVGNSEDAAKANRFADYLLTQGIEAKVTVAKAGWDVWVIEEDRVAKARELWASYVTEPDSPTYAQASQSARKLRQLEEREEKAYERRQETFERRVEGTGAIRAPLTIFLIIVSVVVYLLGMSVDKKRVQDALWFQAPPGELQIGSPRGEVGFLRSMRIPLRSISQGEVWRLVSPIFLHLDGIHLLFNMLMLSSLGTALERSIGTWRMALMVLVLAVFSNCAEAFFGPGFRFGGMSGVLYGIAGFIWVASVRAPRMGLFMSPGTAMLLVGWLLMGIVAPVPSSPMANWAHGAGLVGGLAMGWVMTTLSRE